VNFMRCCPLPGSEEDRAGVITGGSGGELAPVTQLEGDSTHRPNLVSTIWRSVTKDVQHRPQNVCSTTYLRHGRSTSAVVLRHSAQRTATQ
jgi:hypothetical protein